MVAWFQQHRRASGIGVTITALVLLGVAGFLGLAMFTREQPSTADLGSSSQPSASAGQSPSAGATPTSEPTVTPEPTPGFEAPAGILPPNSRAVVVVDALQVRERPGLASAVVDTLLADTVVDVSGLGPSVVDGIDWYSVVYDGDQSGFAAAGSGADRYLELLPPRCEDGEPDLAALARMTAWERLACFGDRSLTVTGTYGCAVCGYYGGGTWEPHWLASPENLSYLGTSWPAALILHVAPAAGLDPMPRASIVRVTGHFNDPASSTCVIGPTAGEQGEQVDPVIADLWCREQFVVDAYEIIGTDPDFAYSFPP